MVDAGGGSEDYLRRAGIFMEVPIPVLGLQLGLQTGEPS